MVKQAKIWIGIGCAFVVAVSVGYVPDLMLSREMNAAKSEGLTKVRVRRSSFREDHNLWVTYRDFLGKYNQSYQLWIDGTPATNSKVSPMFRAFLDLPDGPTYYVPEPGGVPNTSRPMPSFRLEDMMVRIGSTVATRATSEQELQTVIQVANHLRSQDPAKDPYPAWERLTVQVTARLNQLGLPASVDSRLRKELGTPPDPREILHEHVANVIHRWESYPRHSVGWTQRRLKYLRFWRSEFAKMPQDPAAIMEEIAAKADEIDIIEGDANAGRYDEGYVGGINSWKAWALAWQKAHRALAETKSP